MIDKLLKLPTDKISIQIFRYFWAGAVAYAVDCSLLAMLVEVYGVYYLTAAAIAFLVGNIVSYALAVLWVFDRRTFKNKNLEFLVFVLLGIAGVILNHYCIRFFTEFHHMHYLESKFIAMVAVSIFNFTARKYILFR